jgi:hypothetical protein
MEQTSFLGLFLLPLASNLPHLVPLLDLSSDLLRPSGLGH